MSLKRKLTVVAALLAVLTVAVAQPAHAQTISYRYDQANYTPGSSGTLYVTIVNTSPTNTLEIRNITYYFPWAGFYNGNWLSGGNITVNLSPFKVLTTSVSPGGGNIYSWSTGFSVPGWYGGLSSNCPFGTTSNRYGIYNSCFLLGTNQFGLNYETTTISISMAAATYTSASLSLSTILPIASFAVLIVAVVLLFLAWTSLRRLEPRKSGPSA